MYAVRGNQSEAVIYLLSLGVDPNAKDRWGSRALDFAATANIETALLAKGAILGA